jgi:hypothetical protein
MAEKTQCKWFLFLVVHLLIVRARVTAIYAQGVGLGATKAREIGKFSEGYSGYVQQAQEAVSATTGVLETHSLSHKSQIIFSTLPVHVRLANVMEAEGSQKFNTPIYFLVCISTTPFVLLWIPVIRFNKHIWIFFTNMPTCCPFPEDRHRNVRILLFIGKPGRTAKD